MSDRLEFREKLGGILQKAQGAQNVLSVREVEEYFAEDGLSREQMELVCDYLLSQKVAVKGYVKQGGTVTEKTEEQAEEYYTEEEKRYLARYMEEIKTIKAEEAGERQKLFAASIEGDALARGRLIELYLEKVVEAAKEMYHKEVFLGDLIQEGCKPDACTGRIGIRGGSAWEDYGGSTCRNADADRGADRSEAKRPYAFRKVYRFR